MREICHRFLMMMGIVTFCWCVPLSAENHGMSWELKALGSLQSARGYVQIPRGGKLGTSSDERPMFGEAGASFHSRLVFQATKFFSRNFVEWAYERIRLEGSKGLATDLITHDIFIPSGALFRLDAKLDEYRFGGGLPMHYRFWAIEWQPVVDMTVMDFAYRFRANERSSSREFHALAGRVGMMGDYLWREKWATHLRAGVTIPIGNLSIHSGDVDLSYRWVERKAVTAHLHMGVGLTYIDFKDKQELPNHIHYLSRPRIILGVSVQV